MSKVTVISASLRTRSTSRTLLDGILKGLKENGHEINLIDLRNVKIGFCNGCLACQELGKCVIKDDINGIIPTVKESDTLVFVTPIYYYSIPGQLKTLFDRMNALYTLEDRKFKNVYAVFTCADDQITAIEGPKKAIEGWIECFDGVELKDTFAGLSLNEVEDIDEETLKKAYSFGKAIK